MSARDYNWKWSQEHGDYYRWITNPDGSSDHEWARNKLPTPAPTTSQFPNTPNPPTQSTYQHPYQQQPQQNQQPTPAEHTQGYEPNYRPTPQPPSGQPYPHTAAAPPAPQSYGQNPYNPYQPTTRQPGSSPQSDRTTGRGSMGSPPSGNPRHTPQSSDDSSRRWSPQSQG